MSGRREGKTSTTRLPRELLEQLQISNGNGSGGKSSGRKVPGRKERRRNDRMERKQTRRPTRGNTRPQSQYSRGGQQQHRRQQEEDDGSDFDEAEFDESDATPEPPAKKAKVKEVAPSKSVTTKTPKVKEVEVEVKEKKEKKEKKDKKEKMEKSSKDKKETPKSILKPTKPTKSKHKSDPEAEKPVIRKAVRDQLAKEDAEIAALEKKLKIKSGKLPKSFEEDGLDFLLEGLERFEDSKEGRSLKRKRVKEPEPESESESEDEDEEDFGLGGESGDSDVELGDEDEEDFDSEGSGDEDEDEDEEFAGFDSDDDTNGDSKKDEEEDTEPAKSSGPELDIYGKPKNQPVPAPSGKYIPPSLRRAASGEDEELVRLKRQVQGTLNRLSESNILAIITEIEQLYRNNPRNNVTTTLTAIILGTVCDRSTHLDTFMVLYAGFVAALYKIMGTDFGAHVVQTTVEMFDRFYGGGGEGKQCMNLVAFLSELYNFQVVGSALMFDFVRMFLQDFSEANSELLLKVVRNSGPQLRADDPTALKDLVIMMQSSVAKIGEENMTVRTKFTVETITNLKNNKLKAAVANTQVLVEATNRMKKLLGSLNMRQLRATEPLRASLEDIRGVETKGKWWLVGASWRDNLVHSEKGEKGKKEGEDREKKVVGGEEEEDMEFLDGQVDLFKIAREQRMNTDVRRAIFVTIMSGEDFQDAYNRLVKLRLKKTQQHEIPRVLLHCCGGEQFYNPYYALVARRLCSQHSLKMTFQFCLWDFFRSLGEEGDYEGAGEAEEADGEDVPLRKVVNLAQFYGTLIAEGALGLGVLKNLDLTALQKRTRNFLEIMLNTVVLKTQPRYKQGERNEKAVMEVFLRASENTNVTRGLLYFLKKWGRKTGLVGGEVEGEVVRWGVKVAREALKTVVEREVMG